MPSSGAHDIHLSTVRIDSPLEDMRMMPLSRLKRWDRNYRRGDVEAIAASINRFGFNGVLRVWKGTVMAGNHAYLALCKMKQECSPLPRNLLAEGEDWLVPCIDISHLSEAEARAYAIADNRTQELGANDAESLASLLAEISDFNGDLLLATGYGEEDLAKLISSLGPPDFSPGNEEEQGALDQPKQVECPECGHAFAP
jgi:ParB-like chromosome segregation protein Spo0J